MEVKKQQIKKPQINPQCNGNKQGDADRNAEFFSHHPQDHVVFNQLQKSICNSKDLLKAMET